MDDTKIREPAVLQKAGPVREVLEGAFEDDIIELYHIAD